MKTAIVYYSMLGNTKYVSDKIAEQLGAADEVDVIRIEPAKAYPDKGFKKFFWGGKSATMAEKPELVPYDFDAEKYDRIIWGTPVWAGTFTPPLRTFIAENPAVKAKQSAVFMCSGGGSDKKAKKKLAECLGIDAFVAEVLLFDPKDNVKDEDAGKIEAFCKALME